MNQFFKIFFFSSIISFLIGCASTGSLSGGPKDTTPPKVNEEKSSMQKKLNSKDRSFSFLFDEFVEVKNALKEVQVSPPLLYIPKVKSKGKLVTFELNDKEVLKDSTTYIINFGESIVDYREANPLKNFTYVFSTGNVIDSFMIDGKVVDQEKSDNNATYAVMVYDDMSDSIIMKKKPYYSTKTSADGSYTLKNLKKGIYKIIAIKDENSNYLWDEINEKIGFVNSEVKWDTSITSNINIVVSKPEPKLKIQSKVADKILGISKIKLNSIPAEKPMYQVSPKLEKHHMEVKDDSLLLWYSDPNIDSFSWMVLGDTFKIVKNKSLTKIDTMMINPKYGLTNIKSTDTIFIQSGTPIQNVDVSKIVVKDSLQKIDFTYLILDLKTIAVMAKLGNNKSYDAEFIPGAISDWYGNKNDTMKSFVQTVDQKKLSEIILNIEGLDSTKTYQVFFRKSNRALATFVIENKSNSVLTIEKLVSDEYEVEIIEDHNKNGRFDPSSYWLKRQAERRKIVKLDRLKENWKLETDIMFID